MTPAMSRRRVTQMVEAVVRAAAGRQSAILDVFDAAMRIVRGQSLPENLPDRSALSGLDLAQPEVAAFLQCDDALGRVYQILNEPALKAAYRETARLRRKFTAEEIPTVTQLFTPRWVVEFLLHNTLGKMWREMHSANDPERSVKTIRICDPACGTMNFGMVAIEMLRQMYRQEIKCAGQMGWPSEKPCTEQDIDGCILKYNLFGFDIDPVAIDLARRAFEIKIGRSLNPQDVNLQLQDSLASLPGKFDVVVTNPPYLSARNMDKEIVRRMKKDFPAAWRDAYACFIIASLRMLEDHGRAGILSMHSFMFTAAFEKMRREIVDSATIETMAHFGPGLFDVGNPGTLQTVAFTLRRESKPEARDGQIVQVARLVNLEDKQAGLQDENRIDLP